MESAGLRPADVIERASRRGVPITQQRLWNWTSGTNDPQKRLLPILAEIVGVSLESLVDERTPVSAFRKKLERPEVKSLGFSAVVPTQTVRVPLVGYVGAGVGSDADLSEETSIEAPVAYGGHGYAGMIVDGPSLMPYVQTGDALFFRPMRSFKTGYLMAARLPDDPRPVCKEVADDGVNVVLRSFNSRFTDIPAEDVECLGLLIGIDGVGIHIGPELNGITRKHIENKLRSRLPEP
jgi:SOS-response transcriptional repressor LexA